MLFPILGIKHKTFKPDNTYLAYKDVIKIEDNHLICSYKREHSEEYYAYRNDVLTNHPMFVKIIPTLTYDLIVYNLSDYNKDYRLFIEGKYSKFSKPVKDLIMQHYESALGMALLDSHINPEEFHELYAKEYGVDIEVIREAHETLTPPNLKNETL
jgi:hypothetical protein